jgi:anti-anti-sigma regulatory factor
MTTLIRKPISRLQTSDRTGLLLQDERQSTSNEFSLGRPIQQSCAPAWSMRLDEIDGCTLVVKVSGNLGSLSWRSLLEFEAKLDSTLSWAPPIVIVDLSGVEFFGAALMGILVGLSLQYRWKGTQIIVSGDRCGLFRHARLKAIPAAESLTKALSLAGRFV